MKVSLIGWAGRIMVLIAMCARTFWHIEGIDQISAIRTFLVVGLVFMYEDFWSLLKAIMALNVRFNAWVDTPLGKKVVKLLLLVFLTAAAPTLIFLSFSTRPVAESNAFGFCIGLVLLIFWVVLVKFWKKI